MARRSWSHLAWLTLGTTLLALSPVLAERTRPAVAVLGFQNRSGYGGKLLGRRAADQLALDLGLTGYWRVLDRAQCDRVCAERDLSPPYAVGSLQELGHALEADLVFTGIVQSVEISPRSGEVRTRLYVEAVDQVAGQPVLGVQQLAVEARTDKQPVATDVLVGRAMAQVCAAAAALSAQGPGVQGQVSDPGDGKVLTLTFADKVTLEAGQRLLLYRAVPEGDQRVAGKLIGSLMVVETKAGACRAKVLGQAGDIHTEDLAVTIGAPPKRPTGGQK